MLKTESTQFHNLRPGDRFVFPNSSVLQVKISPTVNGYTFGNAKIVESGEFRSISDNTVVVHIYEVEDD